MCHYQGNEMKSLLAISSVFLFFLCWLWTSWAEMSESQGEKPLDIWATAGRRGALGSSLDPNRPHTDDTENYWYLCYCSIDPSHRHIGQSANCGFYFSIESLWMYVLLLFRYYFDWIHLKKKCFSTYIYDNFNTVSSYTLLYLSKICFIPNVSIHFTAINM